jgi:inhibitor of cysteine peptidase
MRARVITGSADGGMVELAVGEPVILELEETPTTGYRWSLELDPELEVKSANHAQHADSAIGGGGVRRFVVAARTPGERVVRARLWREWGGEGSIIKRFEVSLRVQ